MKTDTRLSILSVLVLASSLVAFSAGADTTTPKSKPCQEIKTACEAGGFVKGAHKKDGKGLYKDCIQKIMAGESVAGVSLTADQVSACKARKAKHAAAKAAKAAG